MSKNMTILNCWQKKVIFEYWQKLSKIWKFVNFWQQKNVQHQVIFEFWQKLSKIWQFVNFWQKKMCNIKLFFNFGKNCQKYDNFKCVTIQKIIKKQFKKKTFFIAHSFKSYTIKLYRKVVYIVKLCNVKLFLNFGKNCQKYDNFKCVRIQKIINKPLKKQNFFYCTFI